MSRNAFGVLSPFSLSFPTTSVFLWHHDSYVAHTRARKRIKKSDSRRKQRKERRSRGWLYHYTPTTGQHSTTHTNGGTFPSESRSPSSPRSDPSSHTFLMVTHSHSVHLLPWRGWQPINPTMMAAVVMEGLGRLLSVSRSHPARTLFLYHHWLRERKRETSINAFGSLELLRMRRKIRVYRELSCCYDYSDDGGHMAEESSRIIPEYGEEASFTKPH